MTKEEKETIVETILPYEEIIIGKIRLGQWMGGDADVCKIKVGSSIIGMSTNDIFNAFFQNAKKERFALF